MIDNQPIRDVTVAEMLEAMGLPSDDTTFRYFQTSTVNSDGVPQPGETLRLTVGALRQLLPQSRRRDPATCIHFCTDYGRKNCFDCGSPIPEGR